MKQSKRITAAFLAIFLMTNAFPAPVFAARQNTPKEEVVYINLNADGSVKEINIVNIFDLDEKGRIVDYGKYESLRNMTTTDAIRYENDTVTIDAGAGKLYYEGRLRENVMPWTISLRYFINDTEYSADDIAGMSGKFQMKAAIRQDARCDSSFFENYALQATFTLDTDKAANIAAKGATMANVGGDKQLIYTIMPGKGAEIEITADVTNFEMDGVSISGIPLNLNIEVDDAELMDRAAKLQEAVEELDDGTGALYDGVSEFRETAQSGLQDGVSALKDGADRLHRGTEQLREGGSSLQSGAASLRDAAASLDDGVRTLNDGIIQIQNALNALRAKSGTLRSGSSEFKAALERLQSSLTGVSAVSADLSALTDASASIKKGIDALVSGTAEIQKSAGVDAYKAAMSKNGLDIDRLKKENQIAVSSLEAMISGSNLRRAALLEAGQSAAELETQIGQLQAVKTLLKANNEGIAGTETYLTALSQSLSKLLEGTANLKENYAAFDAGITKFTNTLGGFAYQISALSTAVNSLVLAYKELDGGVTDYTDAVARIAAGYRRISDGAARLVTGSGALVSGTNDLYSGTSELLSGISEMYDGTGTLYNGSGELEEGAADLLVGIAKLRDGTGELKNGTSAFREKTEGMDAEISDKIDELLERMTGGDMETVSFASAENTNIDSVQFVIRTSSIKIAEDAAADDEPAAALNFWQKLFRLFGVRD